MLHYGGISWNIPGQHRHAKIHRLSEQQELLHKLSEIHDGNY